MPRAISEQERHKRASRLVIKHYWKETLRNWKLTFPGIMLPAIGTIFVFYIPPLALSRAVDLGVNNQGQSLMVFLPIVGMFAGSWLIGEVMWRVGVHLCNRAESKILGDLYDKGLAQLLARDLSFFHDNFAGALTKRTLSYANRFVEVFDTMLYNIFPNLIPAVFVLIVLATYSVWISLFLAVTMLLAILFILPLIRERRKLVIARETAGTIASGHIADVYGNVDAVRSHSSEAHELKRHDKFTKDLVQKTLKSWDFQNLRVDTVVSPIFVFINSGGLLMAIYLASKGQISFSAIIVVFTYFTYITRIIWEFNGVYRRLETSISDAAQYTELLLTEPTILNPSDPQKPINAQGSIRIENIHFAYDQGNSKLFDQFSLDIPAGQKVGLVGRSGSGKSSIVKLLLRFSDIDSGSIKVDNVDIRQMTQLDLRRLISYVPQDPAMFHRSISENIAYGKTDASQEAIEQAAKKAHAHEFVKELSDGYKTLVGERGVKLSGGQRQRIAIARAILKNSPILLLDEATSALDSESEKLIQDALWKLMEGKTAIVVAHRLSTIQHMDRIVVLDKGKILEEGTHQELLATKGHYSKLWAHQSGGFLEE